ncbi:MAG: GNAT family N-acetyltransferase [Oceanospirillaceae bacterium]|nr:GNAT family N-acetyltransferase [Oceanospirillaceae bacterium]
MQIRHYKEADAREITTLFHESVHAIDRRFYSDQELESWSPTPPDYARWQARLDLKKPFVALINGQIVGFIELDDDGHIDCLYVHKDYQRRGIGQSLFLYLCDIAKQKGYERLYVEASKGAKTLFDTLGFVTVSENQVARGASVLINFSMERYLKD